MEAAPQPGPRTAPPGTVPSASCPAEWTGRLSLDIGQRAGKSVALRQFHDGALRILRPHYLDASGQVAYTVINPGGAYFGADRYLLEVQVQEGASLMLTTQSATKVYRTPQGPARQEMEVRLGPGAVLEYVPDQLIVYREGSYRQRTQVRMDPTASLVLAEVITPGWSPEGTSFSWEELSLRTEVRVVPEDGGREPRLVVDQLRIAPSGPTEVGGVGVMEGFSHTGQLLLADARLDEDLYARLCELVDASDTRSGISRAGLDGVLGVRCVAVRSLARSTGAVADLHRAVIDLLRAAWRGQAPLDLRKH